MCAHCGPLELFSSPSHIISCSTMRWQLTNSQVDLVLCSPPRAQISLATLIDATTGRIVNEPDSGLQYRLRVLSCDAQGLHPGMQTLSKLFFRDDEMIFISWSGSRKPLARIPLGLYINEVKKWPHCDLASKTIATWVSASAYELSQFYSIFQLPTILPIL